MKRERYKYMENNNMKVFGVDGIKVSIPMDMYKIAVKTHVFDEELTEEDKEGNRIYLRSVILAAYTPTLDDLGKIDIPAIKTKYTNAEISENVQPIIIDNIRLYGGNYDSTK